ncbi:MAG: helix-turn-helix transcriptional regulator [Haliscomenobacter sp.]|uniref:helix-turn-helix domain-containing protein n=1 Tax=Haliscomenobacter sp. TaxID=2717303 RepID=UPI0029AC6C73|nr:helix-turn-helix transcriptional regulator [Haliscomenobacter sp.]MDX2070530.1 helix-turn-helix transcriptional regulator [Haliscomenobacter sp.]
MRESFIPVLDNRAFLNRFGESSAFFSTIDFSHFTIVPLENSWAALQHPFPMPAVRSTNHDFIFITGGTTTRMRGMDTFELDRGKILFMPAYQVSRVMSMSRDISGFFVNFSEHFLAEKLQQKQPLAPFAFWQAQAPAMWNMPPEKMLDWSNALQRMLDLSRNSHPDREFLVVHLLLTFFYDIKPFIQPSTRVGGPAGSAAQLAEGFNKMLSEQFDPKKSVADYAALLHVSPNHLNKCVRKVLGKTCSESIAEQRLLEAKMLLRQTTAPLGNIADQLGFADLTHFGRFFRQKTGYNPSDFRKVIDFAE